MVAKYWNGGLNPEPTVSQWALFKKHQREGTTPGNPKWYKNPRRLTKPPPPVGGPARYPRLPTGTQFNAACMRHGRSIWDDPFRRAAGRKVREYVEAFDKANGFKKVSYPWSIDKT